MPELLTDVRTPLPWDTGRPFEVQGHRGARGLRPENTLAGIARALEIGVGSIECDVALSVDDAVVLSHDGTVPSAAEPIPVTRLLLAELRRFDLGDAGKRATDLEAFRSEPGERMATLAGALALIELFAASEVRLDVEIKSTRDADPGWDAAHVIERVVGDMRAHGAIDRCSLRSFDVQVLQEARRQCPRLRRVLLIGRALDHVPPPFAVGEHVTAVPWTINDPARVRELLQAGVDGVCTDRPDVIRATLAAQGVALPPRHRAPTWLGYGWQAWPEAPASSRVD
jgi:glycerophosphoryl diester phosphodiesterase